VPKHL